MKNTKGQSPSTGRRAPCQDSMLHYCPDRASIWRNPIFVLFSFITTTTLFFLFYLGYVTYLGKLARYLTWPHHRLTALLYFYMRACKCQLFTDEGGRKLPKRPLLLLARKRDNSDGKITGCLTATLRLGKVQPSRLRNCSTYLHKVRTYIYIHTYMTKS